MIFKDDLLLPIKRLHLSVLKTANLTIMLINTVAKPLQRTSP